MQDCYPKPLKSLQNNSFNSNSLENDIRETMNYVSIVNGRNLREEYKKYRNQVQS